VGEDILSIPGAAPGCIGMHPTMLPAGRGQAPIPWSIIKDCHRTALSVFFLVEQADAGPIIAQYELDIRNGETSASLFYRIGHTHFTAGLELAERLGDGTISARAQDEAIATRWPKRRPKDGEILPTMTCREISLLVRALLGPYPRAFIQVAGEKVEIRGVEPADGPGRIRFRCRDGQVYLLPT
jgi:methionyl-tRNA formyltransferase